MIRPGAGNDTITFTQPGMGSFDVQYTHAVNGIEATIGASTGTIVEKGGLGTDSLTGLDKIDHVNGGLILEGSGRRIRLF